jgi:hypothetical protein
MGLIPLVMISSLTTSVADPDLGSGMKFSQSKFSIIEPKVQIWLFQVIFIRIHNINLNQMTNIWLKEAFLPLTTVDIGLTAMRLPTSLTSLHFCRRKKFVISCYEKTIYNLQPKRSRKPTSLCCRRQFSAAFPACIWPQLQQWTTGWRLSGPEHRRTWPRVSPNFRLKRKEAKRKQKKNEAK